MLSADGCRRWMKDYVVPAFLSAILCYFLRVSRVFLTISTAEIIHLYHGAAFTGALL